MATVIEWRIFLICVVALLIFSSSVNGTEYRSSGPETKNSKIDTTKDFECDEIPRIQVKSGNRLTEKTYSVTWPHVDIGVTVETFNQVFTLNLKINRGLFSSSYVERVISNSGTSYLTVDHADNNCYYIGEVQNSEDSVAAISTCKGIIGYFTVEKFSYHIETPDSSLHGHHHYSVCRFRKTKLLYGSRNESLNFNERFRVSKKRYKRSFEWPQDGDGRDKVLELYIVNDHRQFINKSSDDAAVFQRAKDIANFASSSFQTLGIFFVLVGIDVWKDKDQISVLSSDINSTLYSWNDYRMRNINPFHYNDHAVLITGVEFSYQDPSGTAFSSSICSNQYSGSIVSDRFSLALSTGSAMARQIGRSFGLRSDSSVCVCPDQNSGCIMNPTQPAVAATSWSSCSILQFNQAISMGLDICLYDVPQMIIQSAESTCGNGIIEKNEQCDCGRSPQTECNPSCCNPTTCQLTKTSSCASGRCCDITRCQILESGRLCRSSSGFCDLPEHCDGVLSTCPLDTYRPDGTSCTINGDSVYCYNGKCRSHRSQCELIWGLGTNSSSIICYIQNNVNGEHYANCGIRWLPDVTYVACQEKDAMCGKLLCDVNVNKDLAYYKVYFKKSESSIVNWTCNSVIFDYGLRIQDPGLVPNGASCGNGKMCVNQTCVDVVSLQMSCHENCQTDQACNNLRNCQQLSNSSILKSGSAMERISVYPLHYLKLLLCLFFWI